MSLPVRRTCESSSAAASPALCRVQRGDELQGDSPEHLLIDGKALDEVGLLEGELVAVERAESGRQGQRGGEGRRSDVEETTRRR